MTKRRLTKQQKWRIEKVQQERTKRSVRSQLQTRQSLLSGDLGNDEPGLVIAHYGQQLDVQPLHRENAAQSAIHRCYVRANIGALVTGDKVVWRAGADNTGVIVARESRYSVLKRPDKFGQLKPVAANIDQILIIIAPEPQPFANLINRYLVAAEAVNIKPSLILNKKDLINDANKQETEFLRDMYQQLGYCWIEVSSELKCGLLPLAELLAKRTSILVGQSGVGKSSLVNVLLPGENLKVGALSTLGRKGIHTTTAAKLYNIPTGGALIDSPGIREFGLWHIDEQSLAEGFIEFRPFLGQCRFRDCQHRSEPDCALISAVKQGKIRKERMASFIHIRDSLNDQQIFDGPKASN
jgi:ribosome biogenesis GTPase